MPIVSRPMFAACLSSPPSDIPSNSASSANRAFWASSVSAVMRALFGLSDFGLPTFFIFSIVPVLVDVANVWGILFATKLFANYFLFIFKNATQ